MRVGLGQGAGHLHGSPPRAARVSDRRPEDGAGSSDHKRMMLIAPSTAAASRRPALRGRAGRRGPRRPVSPSACRPVCPSARPLLGVAALGFGVDARRFAHALQRGRQPAAVLDLVTRDRA